MKTTTITALGIACGVFSLACGAASAVTSHDRQFMKAAAQGSMAEVALGRVMARKATDRDVRRFAEHMVHDHSAANTQLMSLARKKGVTLPSGLKPEDQRMRERLAGMASSRADRAYMRFMVNDHVKDVNEFMKESGKANDSDLHNWVVKTLPTLQDHLKMARTVTGDLRVNTKRVRGRRAVRM